MAHFHFGYRCDPVHLDTAPDQTDIAEEHNVRHNEQYSLF